MNNEVVLKQTEKQKNLNLNVKHTENLSKLKNFHPKQAKSKFKKKLNSA